ncbi:MAG: hypothetical protein A3C06_04325 [Candidatus Taylorbacteria bacterium RIFCSPHIGHO2_02_FULL_46_13]|uniref:MOFRL-associated domain-containing protein n=1 Tax=Candidatus Taylorbacteria bacterium RIFCSPHIGHO2_02_FULL_46_13 TaxID=1802312 RepID=A0A1G2MSX0_9BACT|nr:MAG: hypothetical protein A3C06_04325 [Candidatus Taylorbacteria bacterium RIFCSPHIGHO2_02_FULL_46_13]
MSFHWIKNFDALALDQSRTDALAILEAGYDAIETSRVMRSQVSISEEVITIQDKHFDLKKFKNIFLIGFGKGACAEVRELYRMFPSRVKRAVVIDKTTLATCPIEVEAFVGTHPIPSAVNMAATKVLSAVATAAEKDDLVFVAVAGGGSALLCSSDEECEQSTRLFQECLKVGATIEEINTVRKHISELKGGGLAKLLYPATAVGLIFSDIVGGNPERVASGPTYFDTSTVADAQAVLTRYGLSKKFVLHETPKEQKYFKQVTNVVLVSNEQSLSAMATKARACGYEPVVLEEALYEAPDETLAKLFSYAAPGTVVLAGGEVRLAVPSNHGSGGRCQFLALEALEKVRPGNVFVAAASDGYDNSEAAGAIVDEHTGRKIKNAGLDLADYRRRLDTIPVFDKAGDAILTGPVEANVSDWYFVLTEKKS